MNSTDYRVYNNVWLCLKEYRKYNILDEKEEDETSYLKKMGQKGYYLIKCEHPTIMAEYDSDDEEESSSEQSDELEQSDDDQEDEKNIESKKEKDIQKEDKKTSPKEKNKISKKDVKKNTQKDTKKKQVLPQKKKKIFVFIFNQTSPYVSSSKEFERLIYLIEKDKNEHADMFIISHLLEERELSTFIKNKTESFKTNHKTHTWHYKLSTFLATMPLVKNQTIPQYSIVDPEDKDKILKEHNMTSVHQFPRIPVTDTQMVWIGAKVGDIIKSLGPSEKSGSRLEYRIVVNKIIG